MACCAKNRNYLFAACLLLACVLLTLAQTVHAEDRRDRKTIDPTYQLVPVGTGVYASNVRQLAPPARFHHAQIELDDGGATGSFDRLDASWHWYGAVSTYARYGETQRVATPAQLGCTHPEQRCHFPHAFVVNPLQQATARTLEAGVRGHISESVTSSLHWSVAPFVTVSDNDIVFVRSGQGTGYFENIGKTRRRGIEAAISAIDGKLRWFANYAYIRATFEDSFFVLSEYDPAANADGDMPLRSGDRLPGIPLHSAKMGVSYALTPRWQIALDTVTTSSRVLRGEEGSDQPRVNGFTIMSAHGSYRIRKNLEAFVLAENILDTEYETFSTFGVSAEIPLPDLGYPAADPRFLGPGAPRGIWIGLRFSR